MSIKTEKMRKIVESIACVKCHYFLTFQYWEQNEEVYLIDAFCKRCRHPANFFISEGELEC